MNNAIKKKVNRIGLVGKIVSIVLIVLMAVACAGLTTVGIVLAVMPKNAVTIGVTTDMDVTVGKDMLMGAYDEISADDIKEINVTMRINGSEFTDLEMEKTESGLKLTAQTDRMEFSLQRLAWACLSGCIYCAAMLVVFIFLMRLSDGFRTCDSPFADDVIKRMTVFAWVLLGSAVVSTIAEGVVNSLLMRSIDLEFSLNPTGVGDGLYASVSFAPILIALIVLFLSMIFRYGAALQKESDETL